jgi:Sugar (and other) transporter
VPQAIILEESEISPYEIRGAYMGSHVVFVSVGMLAAAGLNLAVKRQAPWLGHLVVLMGFWPALIVLLALPVLFETPNSLIQRGKLEEGRAALQLLRGPLCDVQQEYEELLAAASGPSGVRRCRSGCMAMLVLGTALHLLPCKRSKASSADTSVLTVVLSCYNKA